MPDIILDTNILAEVLVQFFSIRAGDGAGRFVESGHLNKNTVSVINNIIEWHHSFVDEKFPGLVISSSFGFVEIARKFDEISRGEYSVEQFASFVEQPPEWFLIAAVDVNLFDFLNDIPSYVQVGDKQKPVEWADAIHVATAYSRDKHWVLAATDERIRAIPYLQDKIL